jgi:DNA polymerase IV
MPTYRPSRPPDPVFAAVAIRAFSAQALCARRPDLMGRPFVVVRQSRNGHHTVAYACSAEAEALGMEPGTPVPALLKKHRSLLLIPRDESLEAAARESLAVAMNAFTPDFRVKENGSALLDLTGTPILRETSREGTCLRLRERIRGALGIRQLAIGIGESPLIAQVLAASAQPDGMRFCGEGQGREAFESLPPALLPGLSQAARDTIRKYAIATIGQLLGLGREALAAHFGKEGERLYALASGLDLAALSREPEDTASETILDKDINDTDALHRLVRLTVDRLVFRLRKERSAADRFTFEIRYADNRSGRKTFSCPRPTQDFGPLASEAIRIFDVLYTRRVAIKSMRMSARKPGKSDGQLDLFQSPEAAKSGAIGRALDRIRAKHAFAAVLSGSSVFRR